MIPRVVLEVVTRQLLHAIQVGMQLVDTASGGSVELLFGDEHVMGEAGVQIAHPLLVLLSRTLVHRDAEE